MYRIGVVGNYISKDRSPRWEHKEQYKIIIDDPWKIIIHPSLRIELSLSGKKDRRKDTVSKAKNYSKPAFDATIEEIHRRYIIVSFYKDGEQQYGYISMNRLGIQNIAEGCLNNYVNIGDVLRTEITGYNEEFYNWYMRVI